MSNGYSHTVIHASLMIDDCSPIESNDDLLQAAQARSKERLLAFLAAMPQELDRRDDEIAGTLLRENSSGKVKLGKIYSLMSAVAREVAPHVACSIGCSDCCKMNVSISIIEAERLSHVTGRNLAVVRRPVRHRSDEFIGIPCPFLRDNACTVYEHRPFACRAHYSFDDTAYWCHPDRSNAAEFSLLESGGAKQAYQAIVMKSRLSGFADIRDFFPTNNALVQPKK